MVASPAPPVYGCLVGVDIAAASFTASWMTDGRMLPRAVTLAQSPAGFAALQQQLQSTGVHLNDRPRLSAIADSGVARAQRRTLERSAAWVRPRNQAVAARIHRAQEIACLLE